MTTWTFDGDLLVEYRCEHSLRSTVRTYRYDRGGNIATSQTESGYEVYGCSCWE